MLSKSVARRYAAALFGIAQERKELGEMEVQLHKLIGDLAANRELKKVFYHRLIKENDKKAVVKDIFGGRISLVLLNFVNLLIDKKREEYLEEIVIQYVDMANEARNMMDATVTSAIELSVKDLKTLQSRLSEITGKNIRIRTNVEPSLIGGMIIKVGDRVIDGSITKRLELLKKNLMKTQLRLG